MPRRYVYCSCGHLHKRRKHGSQNLPLLVRRPDLLDMPSVEALRNKLARWSV